MDTLKDRRTERLMGGDDRVEFVRIELVLGGSCVEKEVAAAAELRSRVCGFNVGNIVAGRVFGL
jgi:hypothetical protein